MFAQTFTRPSGQGHGFTLIELLVVVAIISLLMSILLPALGVAKDAAKTTVCLANLRTVGSAVLQYTAQEKDYIPAGRIWFGGGGSGSGRRDSEDMWGTILLNAEYISGSKADRREDVKNDSPLYCPAGSMELATLDPGGYLNPPLTGVPDLMVQQHPAGMTAWAQESRAKGRDPYYLHCWYGVNAETWKTELTPFRNIPTDGSKETTVVLSKISSLRNAGDFVGVFDGWWLIDIFWQRINLRHGQGRKANVMLMDGHAASLDRARVPIGQHFRSGGAVRDPWVVFPRQKPLWRFDQLD